MHPDLEKLIAGLPRRAMTEHERAVFARHRQRIADGARLLTREEFDALRRARAGWVMPQGGEDKP